ncbi:hypothetical protein QUF76_18735, partial [Desulfobacterales bacterium HSG16]|nr:hypothetical protein [Desulfobacterales bacterium HSG16]
ISKKFDGTKITYKRRNHMSDEKIYDLVIVGGGPGGMAAGIYAMRAVMDTVMVEKMIAAGRCTTLMRWITIRDLSILPDRNFL